MADTPGNTQEPKEQKTQETPVNEEESQDKTPENKAETPEKADTKNTGATDEKAPEGLRARLTKKVDFPFYFILCVIVLCLVVGGLTGRYLLGGVHTLNTSSVSESQLDTPIASYTYNGVHDLTIRDVIAQTSSLDAAKNDDGSYKLPTADNVVDTARTAITQELVRQHNIQVSDDDLDQYAQQYVGTTDYSKIASQYNMDEDAVKNILRQSAALTKLRDEVVTDVNVPDRPTAPTTPASGAEDTPTQDYATYIINLAGDEWDSSQGTWKDSSSDYAQALANYTVSNDSATYAAAQAAYAVAYQKYAQAQQQVSSEWTNFVNGELSKASIQIYTLEA